MRVGNYMIVVRRITEEPAAPVDGLCELLIDAVDGGASVGFLAPLSYDAAARYWEQVVALLDRGLYLWVAELDGKVVGAVQLEASAKENARHRAEIQKLFVLCARRGGGISSKLMSAAETFADSIGRTLLVLDTQAGSVAESVYRHLGWQRVGEIPDYAASPDGRLLPTAYYYKRVGSSTTAESGAKR